MRWLLVLSFALSASACGSVPAEGGSSAPPIDPTPGSGEPARVEDGSAPVQASPDAGPGGGQLGCGGEPGLQAGSPWPMPGRCPSRRGRTPVVGPRSASIAWTKDLSYAGAGTPTVAADGTVYVSVASGPARFAALDPSNGAEKWSFSLQRDSGSDCVGGAGVIGAGGRIYFGTNCQKLYALTETGTLAWSFTAGKSNVTGEAFVTTPAIAADGTIYVGASDKKLYALRPDGTVAWSFFNDFSYTNEISGGAPVLAPDGTIVYGTLGASDGWVVALTKAGTLKWKFHVGSSVISPAAIAEDGTVYVGSQDGRLYALAADGTEKWAFATTRRIYAGPSLAADGTIYVGGEDAKLYALDPSGAVRWSVPIDGGVACAPSIGGDGTIYLGPQKQTAYALNPDGTTLWSHTFPLWRGDRSHVAIGAKGELYMIAATSAKTGIVAFRP